MNQRLFNSARLALTGVLTAFVAAPAHAFVLSTELTGDPRSGNPDSITAEVTVTSGENGFGTDEAFFEVTPTASTPHPGLFMTEFGFNVDVDLTGSSISLVDPTDWSSFTANGSMTGGGGGFTFDYLGSDSDFSVPGGRVGNGDTLSFLLTLAGTNIFTETSFTGAPTTTSTDTILSGQLAARFQGLSPNADGEGTGGSGIATGDWGEAHEVPEPATIVLIGAGLVGVGLAFRRRNRTA